MYACTYSLSIICMYTSKDLCYDDGGGMMLLDLILILVFFMKFKVSKCFSLTDLEEMVLLILALNFVHFYEEIIISRCLSLVHICVSRSTSKLLREFRVVVLIPCLVKHTLLHIFVVSYF